METATSVYQFSLTFYSDEANQAEVKQDVLSGLQTLKDENKIMRVTGNIDEITTPTSIFKFDIKFETDEANRDTIKTQVVTKLSTLKGAGKVFDVSGEIRETLEYSVEKLTF